MNTSFVFDRIKNATKSAFDKVATTAQVPIDPELRTYEDFKPEDFQKMVDRFGADNTLNYIKSMEAKRLKGG